jgi:low temperature requirement protein LtrA
MLASLLMAAALPEAFGSRGLAFAAAYVALQVGRSAFAVAALHEHPGLRRNFLRILCWSAASGVLWLAGGFAAGAAREALWLAAVVVDYAAPVSGFATPGLGRSHTADWTITGGHLAERCQLFIIIALGESILDTGASFGEGAYSLSSAAAFVAAFLGSVALWWIYFNRAAEDSSGVIANAADPGRLGRSAYTYFHLPMVAGIIVAAVGDELAIADPSSAASLAASATVLGGPALFLAGHALFKWAMFKRLSVPRLGALVLLAALAPFGPLLPPLLLIAAATLISVAVALFDARMLAAEAAGTHA